MDPFYPALYQWFRLLVVSWCEGYFLSTFWPLSANGAKIFLEERYLLASTGDVIGGSTLSVFALHHHFYNRDDQTTANVLQNQSLIRARNNFIQPSSALPRILGHILPLAKSISSALQYFPKFNYFQ